MKNRIIESAILAFGLLMLGLFIQNGIKSFAQRDRAVSVKGLAEKEVQADLIIENNGSLCDLGITLKHYCAERDIFIEKGNNLKKP